MRKFWLLTAGFGLAGCVAALLLINTGVIPWNGKETAAPFLPSQAAPAALAETRAPDTLPLAIPGTDLLAVRLGTYEGPFLEDGSDRNVFAAALLEVKNTGSDMIRTACITLTEGERAWVFELSFLPPGATVLVLEKNGQAYADIAFSAICGTQTLLAQDGGLECLQIRDLEMGKLQITNLSDRETGRRTLRYKSTVGEGAYYVGGITYSYPLESLKPGQTVTVDPPHYAMGASRVVAAEQ